MGQETRNFPRDASMLCVDWQKKQSQRMAYRHRDRDNHRRSLVVWKSALKPQCFSVSVALWSGLSTLGGFGRRSRSSCHDVFLLHWCGSDIGRNLVAAKAIGLDDSSVIELLFVAEYAVLLLEILLFLQEMFCVCRWACEFLCGEYAFRTLRQEAVTLVAMCPSQPRTCTATPPLPLSPACRCSTASTPWWTKQQAALSHLHVGTIQHKNTGPNGFRHHRNQRAHKILTSKNLGTRQPVHQASRQADP